VPVSWVGVTGMVTLGIFGTIVVDTTVCCMVAVGSGVTAVSPLFESKSQAVKISVVKKIRNTAPVERMKQSIIRKS